ncbi:hypothetical protein KFK09_015976 [Dendrobium nobile]|uniref:Receptor-like serine/threonine-protein kinase n=1 Tax=Dendrobium nobile TaxID=94219 RepID=A0A8T3B8D3_DENNO|nr:hypothetical protein KFK09_015976 [Dendrobium nobile]
MKQPGDPHELIILTGLAVLLTAHSAAATTNLGDKLTTNRPLFDGETLISASGVFALGFFSPNNSLVNRYVAIWYNNITSHDVVWVANAGSPVSSVAGSLTLAPNGTLLAIDRNNTVIWSSSPLLTNVNKDTIPTAQLLDSGNLIVTDDEHGNYIWQSFDYPSNTILMGMFIGWDLRTGFSWNITSWASFTDPSPGSYAMIIQLSGVPQLVITQDHEIIYWRGGPWVGNGFTGVPQASAYNTVAMSFVTTREKVGLYIEAVSDAKLRMILNPNGTAQRFVWLDPPGQWSLFWQNPMDECDSFSPCGSFGICNANEIPHCSCLLGFRPKNRGRWALKDVSDGCVRNTTLDCRNGTGTSDGFLIVSGVKLPDTSAAVADGELGLDECRVRCLTNCSCTAYSLADPSKGGTGCIMWAGELKDMRLYANGGQDLYVRVAAIDLGTSSSQSDHKGKRIATIVVPIIGSLLIGFLLISCFIARHKMRRIFIRRMQMENDEVASDKDIDLPLFDFETIADATNNFSDENKLGEGGFGSVYKGKIRENGTEIAVKRLSKSSKQGINEFKNEVMSITKLRHRNLVLLLGCCIQRQERMLIYEYMPNKSLDKFLFDREKKILLDWKIRYNIIVGIARGLLYLHQDSAVRVIHRDLKASNILLNQEMVPKISDFGLARIFGEDEAISETKRVAGTYGYMSPEYVIQGIYSAKSDVFSFGVIVLEVISNQRNRGSSNSKSINHLVELAWSLWNKGKALELVDESISNSFSIAEVLKCIKVGLLCIQERPNDRPLMSSVILMLTSDKEVLPEPKRPGFVAMRQHSFEGDHSSSTKQESDSINEISLTIPFGR